MRKSIAVASLIPVVIAATVLPAHAADDMYFVASLGMMNSDIPQDSFSTQNLFAKVGKEFFPGLAVEGILGLGMGSDKWTSSSGCDSEEVSTDRFIGVQLVGSVPLSPSFKFHGNLSLIQTTATIKYSYATSCYGPMPSDSYSDDDTDLGYGVGVEYQFNRNSAITADYHIFYDDTYSGMDLTVSGFLIGYKQSF